MQINTLIIGFIPLTDITGKKLREIRDDKYFKEFLSNFDLGEVHFAKFNNYKEIIDKTNPLFIIFLGSEYYANEIQQYKNDALIYVSYDAGQIFYRKAEMEAKKQEQITTFTEIAGLIQKIRNDGEEKLPNVRKFASMSYDDMYEMIKRAIISDKEDLKKQAWELLMNNKGHKNFIWMRAQLIVECWQAADAKGKEEFLTLAMKDHIDNGFARELATHTDEEGIEYRQYEFLFPSGERSFYIRRIPIAPKGMEKI
jgi:hypothetical protein